MNTEEIQESLLPSMESDFSAGAGKVNAVARALEILNCFSPSRTELTLTQITQQLHCPKSTLLNQLRTLEGAGFLYRVKGSTSYRLGYKLMERSYCVHASTPIIQYALPVMEELESQTDSFIYLTTHLNGLVFYLESVCPGQRRVRYSIAGKTLPLHCTGCGKAMLSYFTPAQVDEVIRRHGLPAYTPHTITDPEKLRAELEASRRRGFALDLEEETLGVKCVAQAIRTNDGRVAGALSVSSSVLDMTPEKTSTCTSLLSTACSTLKQYAHLFPAIQLTDNPHQD